MTFTLSLTWCFHNIVMLISGLQKNSSLKWNGATFQWSSWNRTTTQFFITGNYYRCRNPNRKNYIQHNTNYKPFYILLTTYYSSWWRSSVTLTVLILTVLIFRFYQFQHTFTDSDRKICCTDILVNLIWKKNLTYLLIILLLTYSSVIDDF